jgi:hypothetical protein
VTSASDIDRWIERVEQMPNYVIDDACSRLSPALNVPGDLADELRAWLTERRQHVRQLVTDHQAEFKGITSWTL